MATTIGLVAAGLGAVYFIVTALLPILASRRGGTYTSYTGGDETAASQSQAYVSPTEALFRPLQGTGLIKGYRRRVDSGVEFHWGSFLDRQLAFLMLGFGGGMLLFRNPVLAVFTMIALVGVDYSLAIRRARAYRDKFLVQLPNALLLISSAMAAGRNFVNALQATTPNLADPIQTELIQLGNRISALRVTEAQAFEMWAEQLPFAELHTISSALAIGNQVGLETYALLRSLSASIQEELTSRNELVALTSQVRSTATVVGYLPVFFVLLIYLITPHFVEPLFRTPVGWITIVIAGGMNYGSRFITKRILRTIEA